MTTHIVCVTPQEFQAAMQRQMRALYVPNYEIWRVGDIVQIFIGNKNDPPPELKQLPYLQGLVTYVHADLAYCEEDYVVASFKLGLEW